MFGQPVFYISSESDDEPAIINDTWLNEGNAGLSELSETKTEQNEPAIINDTWLNEGNAGLSELSETKTEQNEVSENTVNKHSEDELAVQNLLSYEEEVALKDLEDLGNEVDLLCAETLADFDPNFLDNIHLSFLDQEVVDQSGEETLSKLLETKHIDMESGYIDEEELKQICSDINEMISDEKSCDENTSYIELQNVKLEELEEYSKQSDSRTEESKTNDCQKISKFEQSKDYSEPTEAHLIESETEDSETSAFVETSDDSKTSEQVYDCVEESKRRNIKCGESEGINSYSKAIDKIHNPTNCVFKNSECYICSTIKGEIAGDKSKVRSDELYYDWFVRDVNKDQNSQKKRIRDVNKDQNSQKKRKLEDSDDGNEIVVKHFKYTDNFDLFRNVCGSEFSVGSSPETSNDDEQFTEQEKVLYREKEKDMARSVLHILTAPYFELKYPDEKRAMFIMSRATESILSLSRELFTMYRHVLRRRSRIYMQTIRRNIRNILIELIVDMLLDRSVEYNDIISMTANFEDCFHKIMENDDFKLPFSHTKSERDLESYTQLICDRAIVASTMDMKGIKSLSSISPIIVHNDTVVTTYVYLSNLSNIEYKDRLLTQVQHHLYHSLHIPYA